MAWTYEQATGRLIDPTGTEVATGYAGGNCGQNPEGKNNPALQDKHGIGPLPQGTYTFDQVENSPHLGPFAIILEPDPANEMFGRSSFRIHGDSINNPGAASEGCMIFPRAVRELVWASGDHTISVVSGEQS